LATPLKAWAQRFAFVLLIGAAFGLMMLTKADTLVVERARVAVNDAVAPILDAVAEPVSTVSDVIQGARGVARLQQTNNNLRAEIERLSHWQQVAREVEAENASLRALLNFTPEPGKRFVAARVIGDQGSAFTRAVLVNAGSSDGLAKGQAAVSGDDLVGRVAEVGHRSARILLITDINSRIPVVVGPRRDRAVLAGDNSLEGSLLYLASDTTVRVGDRVTTSGQGGVLPAGLSVGVVSAIDDKGVRVRSMVDWAHLEFLRIVDYEMPGLLAPLRDPGTAADSR
jgi:rod shape-determining protein MreC